MPSKLAAMDWAKRVVITTPLSELWNEDGPLRAERRGDIGAERVRALLRESAFQFVVADAGHPLQWVPASDCFRFWKEEVAPRLVEPGTQAFRPDAYPGAACFVACEWNTPSGSTVVLLERHH
jgi:hypothetical protein